jgi:hypothetical protein
MNFAVDALALVGMVAMAATGLVIRYTLPPGSGGREGGRASTLWGLSRHGWGDVHFWIAIGIAAMLLLHVFLHWQWVWKTVLRYFSSPTRFRQHLTPFASKVWGFGFFLLVAAVIAGFLWIAESSVLKVNAGRPVAGGLNAGQPPTLNGLADEHGENGADIRGSMTLGDVATQAGVEVNDIKKWLGIPTDVSSEERLGRLKREYGFELSDLRRILASHANASPPTQPSREGAPARDNDGS